MTSQLDMQIALMNMRNPESTWNKANSRYVRSLKRATKVIKNWTPEQLELWRNTAKDKNFRTWYKYRYMVQRAYMANLPDDAVLF